MGFAPTSPFTTAVSVVTSSIAGTRIVLLLLRLHRWIGVAAGLYVILACTTGAALVFRVDLQRAQHPQLFTAPDAAGADIAAIMESVRDAYPRHRLSGVDAPTSARQTFLAYVTSESGFLTLFADPATGAVRGEMPPGTFIAWLQDLHFNLLGGRTGRVVNGIGAACLLLMVATGVPVWWPRRRHVRWRLRDVHGVGGAVTAGFVLLWSVTGFYFAFPSAFRAAVGLVSPITVARAPQSRDAGAERSGPGDAPSWRALIDIARARVPGQHVARVVVPADDRGAFLVMFSPQPSPPPGSPRLTSVYLDQFTGEVLEDGAARRQTMGDRVMAWVAPLHVGNFAGAGVKVAWSAGGLAITCLAATGLLLWLRRPRRRR